MWVGWGIRQDTQETRKSRDQEVKMGLEIQKSSAEIQHAAGTRKSELICIRSVQRILEFKCIVLVGNVLFVE